MMKSVQTRKPKVRRKPRSSESGRQIALEAIEDLPPDATIDEVLDAIITHARIRRALQEERDGKLVPHATVVQGLQRWRSK